MIFEKRKKKKNKYIITYLTALLFIELNKVKNKYSFLFFI